jgi:hypothetical protein
MTCGETMQMRKGFPINWDASPADTSITQHPLYTKYNLKTFGTIAAADVKADLNGISPTTESAGICAYLSWLLRTLALLA